MLKQETVLTDDHNYNKAPFVCSGCVVWSYVGMNVTKVTQDIFRYQDIQLHGWILEKRRPDKQGSTVP